MSGELYDVLVLGPADANPVAEARLAAALAGRIGQPITDIAQALSDKNLNVGQNLERLAAEALVSQLQSMGALTSIRRSVGAFPPSGQMTPPPGQVFRPQGTPIGGSLQGLAPTSGPGILGPNPGSGARLGGLGANPSSAGSLGRSPPTSPGTERPPSTGQGLRPLGALRSEPAAPTTNPAGARIQTNGLGFKVPTGAGAFSEPPSSRPRPTARSMAVVEPVPRAPSPVATPAAPTDPFASPEANVGNFELDRGRKQDGHRHTASVSISGASGLNNPKLVAPKAASGLEVSGAKRDYTERCPRHGLLYDSRKSSACRKCLSDGTKAATIETPGSLRSSPGRRALLGLLFALVLGFLPAAYYSRGPGSVEVNKLRDEQQQLSKGLGNETSMRRFDELEELVLASRRRSMQFTLVVWIAASGLMLGVWYKIT
jgi:hypothetical protein